jgi:hypothetical protein
MKHIFKYFSKYILYIFFNFSVKQKYLSSLENTICTDDEKKVKKDYFSRLPKIDQLNISTAKLEKSFKKYIILKIKKDNDLYFFHQYKNYKRLIKDYPQLDIVLKVISIQKPTFSQKNKYKEYKNCDNNNEDFFFHLFPRTRIISIEDKDKKSINILISMNKKHNTDDDTDKNRTIVKSAKIELYEEGSKKKYIIKFPGYYWKMKNNNIIVKDCYRFKFLYEDLVKSVLIDIIDKKNI